MLLTRLTHHMDCLAVLVIAWVAWLAEHRVGCIDMILSAEVLLCYKLIGQGCWLYHSLPRIPH